MFMRGIYLAVFALTIALPCSSPVKAGDADPFASVKGVWLTPEKDGAVELYACGGELCGKFYWLKPDPENATAVDLDDRNPDPHLRNRPLCGMQFLGGFTPQHDGKFTGGWIYSPRHGAKFSSAIRPKSHDAIELRGYVLLPFLGESQTWTRAQNIAPCQPQHNDASTSAASKRG